MLLSASATVVLQGASMVISFATAILLARLLGGGGYGRYVFALAWSSVLTIPAILGLDRFLVRGMAIYEVKRQWQLMGGLLRRTNQLVLVTSVAITAVGCLIALLWLSPSLRWSFCVAMLLVPITALTLLRQGAMQAIGQVLKGQLPEYLIRPILILIVIGILDALGAGDLTTTTALAANVVGGLVAFATGIVLLRRALPTDVRSVRPAYATRDWMRASLPMMLISGIWMTNAYITTLVVGTLDGTRAAGVLNVSQKGAELIVILLAATNMPLAPAIARMHAHKDIGGLQHATERVAQATLLVSVPIAAVLAIVPGLYLSLFGSGFQTGATALTILAVAQLVNAASGPSGNVLIMTGYERIAVRGVACGLLANLVLGVILVPPLGVTGGAIASAASLVLWNTALVVVARRQLGVNVTAFPQLAVTKTHPTS